MKFFLFLLTLFFVSTLQAQNLKGLGCSDEYKDFGLGIRRVGPGKFNVLFGWNVDAPGATPGSHEFTATGILSQGLVSLQLYDGIRKGGVIRGNGKHLVAFGKDFTCQ
jgi:hypothetical protein